MARKPVGELTQKLAARAWEGRSKLYRWTRERYAELAAARKAYQPTWQAIADLAAEAGQLDTDGKPPSAAGMRKIYLRVERDIEQERSVSTDADPTRPSPSRARRPSRAGVAPNDAVVREIAARPPSLPRPTITPDESSDDDPDDRPRFNLKPIQRKGRP